MVAEVLLGVAQRNDFALFVLDQISTDSSKHDRVHQFFTETIAANTTATNVRGGHSVHTATGHA